MPYFMWMLYKGMESLKIILKIGIDLMTISSGKNLRPKGVGNLQNKNIRIKPILLGGGQESLIRSGIENASGIYGFATAANITLIILKRITINAKS